jgi:hypothetical protein
MLAPRRSRTEVKAAGVWTEGMAPPVGLPFGEPAAQSAGAGFLPALPDIPLPWPAKPSWFGWFGPPATPRAEPGGPDEPGVDVRVPAWAPARSKIPRLASAVAGMWLVLAAFAALLLVLAVSG